MSWVKLIPQELQLISESEYVEPADEVRNSDVDVGEMNETQKRLYTLAKQLTLEVANSDKSNLPRVNELADKAEIIWKMLWADICDTHSLWKYPTVGVRRGYRVVYSKIPRLPIMFCGDL